MVCGVSIEGAIAQQPEIALPETFESYSVSDRLNYTSENLYEYINGGAELYLSYGLIGMKGCKYNGESLPQITVEIYEMTNAANAYGVYTQSRDKLETDYGQGSQSFPDFIMFWKDRYFVIINTLEVTEESGNGIKFLAKLIDASISETGTIPEIVGDLPEEGLAEAGFIYFHHYIWLNSFYFIADYNILDINEQTDAVLAKYGSGNERLYVLMVDYPEDSQAKAAYQKMKSNYAPEISKSGKIILLEDKTWFALDLKGKRIYAIFNGKTREKVQNLLNCLNHNN